MSEPEQPERPKPAPPVEKAETANVGKPGTKTEKPRQIESAPTRERTPHGLPVLAIVTLILALIALAGVGVLGWSWYQLRGEQARISRLEGRMSALSGQLATVGQSTASAKSVNALAGQIEDLRQGNKQRLDAMAQNLHELTSRIAGADIAFREDEAAALMRLAQARLMLESDPAGATQALNLADQALGGADDPALAPVHVALMREIAALDAVPKVDVADAYIRLETLMDKVNSLPLAGSALAHERAPERGTASSGFSWSGIGAAFKRAFSPLIVVRHGPAARPLLPPDDAYFVRENVKLALASAQLALLQRNAKAWQASLGRASSWLSDWFANSNPEVRQATATLNQLAALKLAPALPTLGAALAELAAIRAQAAAAVPTPSAATR